MRHRDARNVAALARYLDRDWLAPRALRAFKELVSSGQQCDRVHIQEAVGPWDGEPGCEPNHSKIPKSCPALLDPAGQLIR